MAPLDVSALIGCLAADPAIGGVLFVDLDPRLLMSYAEALAAAVRAVEGHRPAITVLGAGTTDDELWPSWAPVAGADGPSLVMQPGLLSEWAGRQAPVVVVPDLVRASTTVTRAALTVIGADVVHVERHGISDCWRPTGRWLAACLRGDLPLLSAHLLSRFPIRCDGRELGALPEPADVAPPSLRSSRADFPDDQLDLVLRTVTGRPNTALDLVITRLARALAERRGAASVTRADVTEAASLAGLAAPADRPPAATGPAEPRTPEELAKRANSALAEPDQTVQSAVAEDVEDVLLLQAPDERTVAEPATIDATDPMRPEDDSEALPEPRSLHGAATGFAGARQSLGVVIGHERSSGLTDLAIIPTLFEAVKRTGGGRLTVRRGDLRRFRRWPGPQHALVLVLDHTARRGWDCLPGLAPHLRWAYDRLAAVSLIEFGHREAADELRPERYRTRSVADRRIMTSLTRAPGSASPLAAAVGLASEELRRLMHRGWASVRSARLVVVTDGRGNVRLEATAERLVTGRVAREGIVDSLTAARTVAGLQRVETTVVAPVDEQYPELARDLADALGGTVALVRASPGSRQ